jgi:hypothetical protein
MKKIVCAAALFAMVSSAGATGIYQCEPVAASKWLTSEQLKEKLVATGWQVNRMKKDGGCWEVYGVTPEGKKVEGYFHPASGKQLLLNQRGKIIFRAN